jgi:hypothetical protein
MQKCWRLSAFFLQSQLLGAFWQNSMPLSAVLLSSANSRMSRDHLNGILSCSQLSQSRWLLLSLRGGEGHSAISRDASSLDNFTTNEVEQADANQLKSLMGDELEEDQNIKIGSLADFAPVEISSSGIFKYVLIEATDKEVGFLMIRVCG